MSCQLCPFPDVDVFPGAIYVSVVMDAQQATMRTCFGVCSYGFFMQKIDDVGLSSIRRRSSTMFVKSETKMEEEIVV